MSKEFRENNHLKPQKNHISICDLRPDQVDAIILGKLNSMPVKGGKKTSTAWTEDELLLRDAVIMSYIVENGLSKFRTVQQIMSRWDISNDTAKRYVNEAIHRFAEEITDKGEQVKKVFIEKVENIASEALNSLQYDTALKAYTEIGKMMGFYREQKDVTINGELDVNFKFDEGEND